MSGTDKALYALVNQVMPLPQRLNHSLLGLGCHMYTDCILTVQVLETLAGLGIVYIATKKFMPLSPDLLKYDFR